MDIKTLEYMTQRVDKANVILARMKVIKAGIQELSEEKGKITSLFCQTWVMDTYTQIEGWAPNCDLVLALTQSKSPTTEQKMEVFQLLKKPILEELRRQLAEAEKELAEL